jgi:hypothetical protein
VLLEQVSFSFVSMGKRNRRGSKRSSKEYSQGGEPLLQVDETQSTCSALAEMSLTQTDYPPSGIATDLSHLATDPEHGPGYGSQDPGYEIEHPTSRSSLDVHELFGTSTPRRSRSAVPRSISRARATGSAAAHRRVGHRERTRSVSKQRSHTDSHTPTPTATPSGAALSWADLQLRPDLAASMQLIRDINARPDLQQYLQTAMNDGKTINLLGEDILYFPEEPEPELNQLGDDIGNTVKMAQQEKREVDWENMDYQSCQTLYVLHLALHSNLFTEETVGLYTLASTPAVTSTSRTLGKTKATTTRQPTGPGQATVINAMIDDVGEDIPEPWRPLARSCLFDTSETGRRVRKDLQTLNQTAIEPVRQGNVNLVTLSHDVFDKVYGSAAWHWLLTSEKASEAGYRTMGEYVEATIRATAEREVKHASAAITKSKGKGKKK